MVQPSRVGQSRSNLNRLQGSSVNQAQKTQKTQKLQAVKSADVSAVISNQQLLQLQERPKLIAELSDSHRAVSQLMIATQKLKQIARDLVGIKQILAKEDFSPLLMNRVDQHKKSISASISYKIFDQYVLDSSFCPTVDASTGIKFKIPGLDLVRERLTNELVTLYLNSRMVPFAFDRTESDRALYQQFALMLAYGEMGLEVDSEKNLLISMPDKYWRQWDLNVHISGQGGRYPEGSHITVKVEPLYATVEMATMLDLTAADAMETLDKVIKRVNEMHRVCMTTLSGQNYKAECLIDFCHDVPEGIGQTIKSHFEAAPAMALKSIQRHYVGPNRENVISLIKK